MKLARLGNLGIAMAGIIIVMLCGCASSPPSQFYILNSLNNTEPKRQDNSVTPSVIVAIGPIEIPDYLEKPEIVTRLSHNELKVNEFHRWAGNFESMLSRTITENLSLLLPANRFSVIRWLPGMQTNLPITYRIMVDVIRFDIIPNEAALFESNWILYDKDKEPILIRRSDISVPFTGIDYNDMVAAMSKAVADFSREITLVIKLQNDGI